MDRAADFLTRQHCAGLPLRPGGRKTSITLEAFRRLREQGRAETMLIIAPLRVCRQTWRQEAAKWEQFKDFKFSLLHGDKKDERLKDDADIWLINPEGIPWLCDRYFGRSFPWDVVCIDELTKFKNAQAERSKAIRPRLKGVQYRWGLTGSLASNGYMDLFGTMLVLDDGAALGRYITHYRDQYFTVGYDGFTYELMPGAEQRIINRIQPYWFKMDDADYAQLPPLVDDAREVELSAPQRKLYDKMKKDMIAALPEGVITAANAAACYSKLSQMANGAVYVGDQKQEVSHIHDLKLEVVDELVDELNGSPLLIAYEFNHDLDRLKAWYAKRFATKDDPAPVLPYLGKGTTPKQEDAWVAAWNKGLLPILAAHPASAGHGLNMQGASACDVAWFSITWDFELYDQFIRRIRRDGTQATQIFNHLIVVKNTIDELKLSALRDKDLTQRALLSALNTEITRETSTNGDSNMKLSRPGGAAAPAPQEQAQQERPQPRGWGNAGATAAPAQDDGQRGRIQEQINPEANRAAFSAGVGAQVENIRQQDYSAPAADMAADTAPKTTRTRRATTPAPEPANDGASEAVKAAVMEFANAAGTQYKRLKAVEIAARCSPESPEDLFALADEVLAYVDRAAA
jgi:SNF2 family DNA or RNA helicase